MKSLILFNNKGGVGKTTLTFNIAHMFARQGLRTVILDYDPQCNASAIALSEEELVDIWSDSKTGATVARCIDPVRRGKGDIVQPALVPVADDLWILPGDLALSRFEQVLAEGWGQIHQTDNERALHITTALLRLALSAARAEHVRADVVLIDVGPNLGALNRAALLAADVVVVPVAPDLFSLQGLRNVGPTLREWREDWDRVVDRDPSTAPRAKRFEPGGYIVQQHLARIDRPVKGYERWASQIPTVFHQEVLGEPGPAPGAIAEDPSCIAMLKHFASLVPLAQEARKPIFDLKQADGIGGGQIQAVAKSRAEFQGLASRLRELLGA